MAAFKSDIPGAILDGYILLNEQGQKLTCGRVWSSASEGWVWMEAEKERILNLESPHWIIKPTHIQKAFINYQYKIQVIGSPERITDKLCTCREFIGDSDDCPKHGDSHA